MSVTTDSESELRVRMKLFLLDKLYSVLLVWSLDLEEPRIAEKDGWWPTWDGSII